MDQTTAHIAAIQMLLRAHHSHPKGAITVPVETMVDIKSGRKSVRATEAVTKCGLRLFPNVPRSCKVYSKSTHPDRAEVLVWATDEVTMSRTDEEEPDDGPGIYFLHPEWKGPELEGTPEDLAQAGPDAVPCRWNGDETRYPFWAVERLTSDELRERQLKEPQLRFNTEVVKKDYAVVVGGALLACVSCRRPTWSGCRC